MEDRYFNPLPRKEGDTTGAVDYEHTCDFNPLPRKEGDHYQTSIRYTWQYFNPLPRKEGDSGLNRIFINT